MNEIHLRPASILFLALALSCSGGGSGGGSTANAPLTLAVTDAASDELAAFVVEVQSVVLERVSGATVGVLSTPAELDFVTLDEVSQVLSMQNVPPGFYRAATITLDFSQASCYLLGEDAPATIYDSNGQVVTGTLELPIQVQGSFQCTATRHTILELDFDLDQSVLVDAGSNSVTLEPAFVLRVDRTDPKEFGVVGALGTVDQAAGRFTMQLQTLSQQSIGQATVLIGDDTVFQLDGVPELGAVGLAGLAGLSAGTWVQCYGSLDALAARVEAVYVEAGFGTYNGGQDIVQGHVIGRVGGAGADPILTVLGHSNNAEHDSFFFNTAFQVNASFTDTKVVRRGYSTAFDTDDLNIGQQVRIFGSLTATTMDAADGSGVIRAQPTRVLGYALGAPASGQLALDLERVDLRLWDEFTWSEGGTSPADPDALLLAVGGLGTGLGIDTGSAVEAVGFFSAIDDDAEDFDSVSLLNRDSAPSLYLLHDREGGLEVSVAVQSQALELALSGSPVPGETAVIDKGFVGAQDLPASSRIVAADGFTAYAIRDRDTGSVEVHLHFEDFLSALAADLGAGAVLYNLGAIGIWDPDEAELAARLAIVVID